MLNWIKTSEQLPNNPNVMENDCLVCTKYKGYFFAYYSIQLEMWRRIEVPYNFDAKKIIDEIIPSEDIVAWVPISEIKMQNNYDSNKNR